MRTELDRQTNSEIESSSNFGNIFEPPVTHTQKALVDSLIPTIERGVVLRTPHWIDDFGRMNPVVGARGDLITIGGSEDLAYKLYSKDGEWIYQDTEQKDVYAMHPEVAFSYVMKVLDPVYAAVTTYLDEPKLNSRPYNDHGPDHVRSVKERATHILRVASESRGESTDIGEEVKDSIFDEESRLVLNIATAIHDIGYIISEDHSKASLALAKRIFPQITQNSAVWERIERVVLFHETGEERKRMKKEGVILPTDAVALLVYEDPVLLALRDADKLDRTRKRVRKGDILKRKLEMFLDPEDMREFLEDPHVESPLFLPVTEVDLVSEKDSNGIVRRIFRVTSVFRQGLNTQEADDFSPYAKPRTSRDGFKIGVAESTRKEHEENGIDYLKTIMDKTLSVEARRILLTVYDTFALNPTQDQFELVFSDAESKGVDIRIIFNRDRLDADVVDFVTKTVPQNVRGKFKPDVLPL